MLRGFIALSLSVAVPCSASDVDAGEAIPLPPAVYAEKAQILVPGGNWEEGACFAVSDGGTSCAGAWLPEPRLVDTGQRLARLEAENDSLKHDAPVMPKYLLIAAGLGLTAGLVVGFGGACYIVTGSPICLPRR